MKMALAIQLRFAGTRRGLRYPERVRGTISAMPQTVPHANPEREFCTVGHSNLELDDFLDMLRTAEVDLIVDVRRLPGSRKYPWFDQENLAGSLRGADIGYRHEVALTGRRPRQRDIPDEVNGFWENRSFHNYADYALSEEFQAGLDRLRSVDAVRPAVLCSEAVWWRCHRRLISDHLLAHGERVLHVMGPGKITPAEPTVGAVFGDDGAVTYPATSLNA